MKKIAGALFALFLLIPSLPLQGAEPAITTPQAEEIVARLREKYIPMYRKYQGVESERQVEIRTYDSKAGKLLRVAEVHLIRKDYFYREPEVQVLEYTVDGKEEKPSDYEPVISPPSHPVFDENGDKNYEVRVAGFKIIDGGQCYEIAVEPKKSTKRHYRGKIYCTVADLDLVSSSGTMAMLAFPVRSFQIDLNLDHLEDLTVATTGAVVAEFNIPILLPNRRIKSNFKTIESKPIF